MLGDTVGWQSYMRKIILVLRVLRRALLAFFKPTRLTIVFLAIFMSIVITGDLQSRYLYDNPQLRDSYYPYLYYVWMWLAAPLIVVGMAFHFGLGLDQISFSELTHLLYIFVPTTTYFYLVSCMMASAVRKMKSSPSPATLQREYHPPT
jgi:hypothetical protein